MVKTIYRDEYADLLLLIRKKRLAVGLTQTEISLKLGAPASFLGKVERGERRIDVIELQALCVILGTTLQDLLDELPRR